MSCLALHDLHHWLQDNLCSGTWSTFCPSVFTDLAVHRVASLTYSHSSLLWLQVYLHSKFFLFLNILARSAVTVADGQHQIPLGTWGNQSTGCRGKFFVASHQKNSRNLPATKTLSCKPSIIRKIKGIRATLSRRLLIASFPVWMR